MSDRQESHGIRTAALGSRPLSTSISIVLAITIVITGLAGLTGKSMALASTASTLQPGQKLTVGQTLISPNNQYKLIMQGDGNLVLYVCSHALWATNTAGHPGAFAVMQTDGNLVVYAAGGSPYLWASWTQNHPNAYLAMQSDGNLVIYAAGGSSYLWASWTVTNYTPLCGGTILVGGQVVFSPNGAFYLKMQTDGNLVLYATGSTYRWASWTQGNSGASAVVQSTDGNIVVYASDGHPLWASGSPPTPGAFLTVQNSGNLVEYSTSGTSIWQAIGLRAVPVPSWWNGMCDAGYNSSFHSYGSWNGLIACGPPGTFRHENQAGSPLSGAWEWQCVELSERWLYQEFGLPQQFANGYAVVTAYWSYITAHPAAHYPLALVTPQSAGPGAIGPGDVVSYANVNGDYGHTNVVTSVSIDSAGNGSIQTLNENSSGSFTLSMNHWNFGMNDVNGNFMPATGWLHFTG